MEGREPGGHGARAPPPKFGAGGWEVRDAAAPFRPWRKRRRASKPEASRTTAAFSVRRLRAQGCFPLSGSLSPREPRIFGAAFACVPTCLRTKEKPCRRRGVASAREGLPPPLRTAPPPTPPDPSDDAPCGGGEEEDRNLVRICQGWDHHAFHSNGFSVGAPSASKSRILRVTTVSPWTIAVAAIIASSISRSGLRCMRRAHWRKAGASMARTL